MSRNNRIENKYEENEKTILTCVRRLAPIASQARHFPPSPGEAITKEENKNLISVKNKIKIYLIKIYVISKE